MRVLQHINDEIRGWSRNIQLFFLASILYQIGNGMFSVLYNLYIQGLGYNDTMNGQIVSIQSLATAIMFVPIGLCGDLFSRKRLLITGALFSGIFLIGRSFDYSATGLIWFAVFSGLFAGVFQVLAIPYLAENVKKSQRLKMFSYYSSLVLASQVLGSLGGGVFADLLHTAGLAKVTGLQTVLFVGGAATLVAFIPLLFVTEGKTAPQTSIPVQPVLQPNTDLKESSTNTPSTDDSITKKKIPD